GHAHKNADGFLNPKQLALFRGNLLGRHGSAQRTYIEGKPRSVHPSRFPAARSTAGLGRDYSGSWRPANRRTAVEGLLQVGQTPEFLERTAIVNPEQITLFKSSHVLHGDIHTFHRAQDAATLFFECPCEASDLGSSGLE